MPQPTPQRGRYRLHPQVDPLTRRRSGDANPRGRLERPDSLFRLREGLAAPGNVTYTDALALVLTDWARQVDAGTISADLIDAYTRQLCRFTGVLDRFDKSRVLDIDANTVLVWMRLPKSNGEAPARNVMAVRRSAARSLFQTAFRLGLTDTNPAKAIDLPDRTERYVHALTDDQIRQLQRVARSTIDDTRRPAALALVMSGTAPVELGSVTVTDTDLLNRRVWVHDGDYRYRPRWLPLADDWCVDAVARRVAAVPTDRYYPGDERDRFLIRRSASGIRVTNLMTSVMTDLLQAHHLPNVLDDTA